ncbi:MAG: type II toxin-antitoxin system VapC family toxin [Candidatus Omnitrophica bacterium]|nr:type II toxin-antitoxin system VapC family toxin [Candidatus Omnitrophota bacterium]MCA9441234.1 type II toxin-antitoxin system VapC family toxin [Candidatus Omnitrophota bacterium]MCA9448412.1 type II toxin-antitoxin system VapC family toxin [Candidatus Omnitrophota bacterium]
MIVLDTHVLIWLALIPGNLSKTASARISEESLAISAIAFLEIGHLLRKGRLKISATLTEFVNSLIETYEIEVIPLTPEIVEISIALLPEVNADPADRIIAASAIYLNAPLVTKDKNLRKAKIVSTVW